MICPICKEPLPLEHWRLFAEHTTCQKPVPLPPREEPPAPPAPAPEPAPEPAEDVTPWQLEKAANRLQRMAERVEKGQWMPRFQYKLNGQAKRALKEAHELVSEAGQALHSRSVCVP